MVRYTVFGENSTKAMERIKFLQKYRNVRACFLQLILKEQAGNLDYFFGHFVYLVLEVEIFCEKEEPTDKWGFDVEI